MKTKVLIFHGFQCSNFAKTETLAATHRVVSEKRHLTDDGGLQYPILGVLDITSRGANSEREREREHACNRRERERACM